MIHRHGLRAHLAYAKYLARHKWFVFRACRITGAPLWRAVVHDLSKVRPSEWGPYLRTFYAPDGTRRYEPTDSFDMAWLLHQRRNPHHWQFWLLRRDDGTQKPMAMPDAVVREMVADWIGAGMAIHGRLDVSRWYEDNKHAMVLEPKTRELAERLIRRAEGADATQRWPPTGQASSRCLGGTNE